MSSSLRVVNRGLVRLGVPPLASLSDASAQALVASSIYEEIKRTALASFPWSFALREARLPRLSLPEEDERWQEFERAYQLPTDCVQVLGLSSYDNYQIAGDHLYTDNREPWVVYIKDVGEQTWPEYFAQAVAFEFAGSVAISLTDDAQRAELMYNQAAESMRQARQLDSQQVPRKVFQLMKIYMRRSSNPLVGP